MIILALVVIGGASFFRLGVDRFPAVDLPTVMVRTTLPGASVEEAETQVSEIIEEAVNRVEGISELRSVSVPGQSTVIVTFNLDRDIDTAAQDVRDRVSAAIRRLPLDAEPPIVSKQDSDSAPVLSVALAGNLSIRELTELADKVVKVQLERSSGVGEVQLVGGLERTINIWVEADRVAAYQLPITDIRAALQRQNADVPGGTSPPVRRSGRCARSGASRRRGSSTTSRSRRAAAPRSACATSGTPRTAPRSSGRSRG